MRLRRKSPLLADPLIALLQRREATCVDSFEAVPELDRYVERRLIPLPPDYRRGYIDGSVVVYVPRTEVLIDVFPVFRP